MKKHAHSLSFSVTRWNCRVVVLAVLIVYLARCSDSKTSDFSKAQSAQSSALMPIVDTEKMPDFAYEQPADNSKYYTDPTFIEFFKEPIAPPPFDFAQDCSNKSLAQLRCLRNELYARHGYLFSDAILRGYFNQYSWYQPIFWDSTFRVKFTKKEHWFIDKVSRLESQHLARNYCNAAGAILANTANIVNAIQFESIPDTLVRALSNNGFALVATRHEQLFHVYDQNVYECIPSYITTDLFLQLLHMHFSNVMKKLETTVLFAKYDKIITSSRDYALHMAELHAQSEVVAEASGFSATYFALAHYLLSGLPQSIPPAYRELFDTELQKIQSHSGRGSTFLDYELFDYSQLAPRGHYTHSEELTRYFQAVKWLMTAPFIISTDHGLVAALVTAQALLQAGSVEYREIEELLTFLTGMPDNLSVLDLVALIQSDYKNVDILELATPAQLKKIRSRLLASHHERIAPAPVTHAAEDVSKKMSLYFMSGRYTFDAEILQRLVHCRAPIPKRPFPKGLDVFAVLGNKKAESVLVHGYKEHHAWPPFTDSLSVLQRQFSTFSGWKENAYTRRMALFSALFHKEKSYPYYMQLAAWESRTLLCALAGWTQLKHEHVLYAKQPSAAQCGEGGIPPPKLVGYVEPNTKFWKSAQELIGATSASLRRLNMETPEIAHIHRRLSDIASFLLATSEKQLARKFISEKDYDRIAYLGGEIENITLTIMDTDHFEQDDPERQIGLVTDVYTHNQTCLQQAIGYGNEIYVVVEINGLLHLTRGAVLSYYEFKHPAADRLTDKKWQAMLEKQLHQKMPPWTQLLFVPMLPLKTKPHYSYLIPGGC